MKYRCFALIVLFLLAAGCTQDENGSDICEVPGLNDTLFSNATQPQLKYSQEEVGNQSVTYLVKTFLEPQRLEGELVGMEEYGENLYLLTIKVGRSGEGENTTLYVTKDGKLILPGQGGGIIDVFEEPIPAPTTPPTTTPSPTTAPIGRVEVSTEGSAYLGPEDAPVVIVEFSEFACPFCKRFHDNTLPLILENYGDRVKFVFRHFIVHELARKASEASECANEQGKFFEYHDLLFERGGLDDASLKSYAEELELDTEQFDECFDSGKYAEKVQKDMLDGRAAGVTGTPAFFINGRIVRGAKPFAEFQQVIEEELAIAGQ